MTNLAAGCERETSQTLARGLRILDILTAAGGRPHGVAELATRLGVSRPVVYRLLYTLEDFRLVRRDADGNYEMSPGISRFTHGFSSSLQRAAAGELVSLADRCQATAMLIVPDGDHAFLLASVEPTNAAFHVAFRPGSRDPINRGAGGIAILAAAAALPGERATVTEARRRGFAVSHAEVVSGASALAAAIVSGAGYVWGSIAVVFAGATIDVDRTAPAVTASARRVAAALEP